MNAHTTITPEGNIPIPADVIERLGLKPGMDIVIDEANATLRLKPSIGAFRSHLPRVPVEQLLSWTPYQGPPKATEAISSISDDAFREIVSDQERRARD